MNAPLTAAEVSRRLSLQLSLPARLGYTALLLVSLVVAGCVGMLLLTEPALPVRTRAAFGVMAAIALAWAAYAMWVLRHRRVLFARHRVIAGRMAVGFAATFVLGTILLGRAQHPGASWYGALSVGLILLCAAIIVLHRANRHLVGLIRRRQELESQLAGSDCSA